MLFLAFKAAAQQPFNAAFFEDDASSSHQLRFLPASGVIIISSALAVARRYFSFSIALARCFSKRTTHIYSTIVFTHGEFSPKTKKIFLWCFGTRNAFQNTTCGANHRSTFAYAAKSSWLGLEVNIR